MCGLLPHKMVQNTRTRKKKLPKQIDNYRSTLNKCQKNNILKKNDYIKQ